MAVYAQFANNLKSSIILYIILFMKLKISAAFILLLLMPLVCSAGNLDIGEDISFEYRYEERADKALISEFRQRIKLYLTGYLEDNIEIGASLQSSGIMNSTAPYAVFEGARTNNLDPFFETAYIKINDYYG